MWTRFRLPARRVGLIAIPAAAALALASAGVVGLSRSDVSTEAIRQDSLAATESANEKTSAPNALELPEASRPGQGVGVPGGLSDTAIGTTTGRAQRVSATLTVEVPDADAVSRAAQDALDLTRRLGGHVVTAAVATGDEGSASLTVRVPVARVQEAIVGLSALGRIVSQQVTIDDLQETLDQLRRRQLSLRSQIALVLAKLESETLDAETRSRLEARLKTLRGELRGIRIGISATNAEARMSTIQLTVVTPGAFGAVAPSDRLDRTIDEAVSVLAWEAVIALALLIVLAPFALVACAAWLGRRVYRRREDERLLAT
jgi:ABC-type phosphate transport system auxiliary subunit